MKRKRFFLSLPRAFLACLCIATLFGFCGRWSWVLDLFSHFRVVYVWALALLVGWFLWRKQRAWVGVALVFCVVNFVTLWPYLFLPRIPLPPASSPRLKVFHANLLVLNTNYAAVQEQIKAESPDIVALAELTPGWFAALEPLKKTYPYFVRNDAGDRFGLGIWSKFPMTGEAQYLGAGARCSVLAKVDLPTGKKLTLLYTHPWPPSKAAWVVEQKRQLAAVAECIRAEPGPKLLLGDLNATPWSALFRKLEHDSGLRDTERDGGIAFTWPAPLPIRIPIDHCLVSPELQVLRRRAGRATGSDHLPLILDFVLQ
ncbi:endonuclease/exonuclease/phosphatase family protein [Armatimonas sp.]|uniref:endonuclease/exonuclease/phosphatase family protein n=1 Tax=Armatimonas sp. TaxID=1872638 RepID=UPI00286C800F|nr:endonuclease/exonuclease/phosphatase family protein [Armatimonas sp.]